MCEQAGTGLRMIREEWKKLGRTTPICRNDRSQKSFEFFLPEPDLVFPTDLAGGKDEPYKSAYKSPYKSPTQSTDPVVQLLAFLVDKELSSAELQKAMKLKHRATFQQNHLTPALEAGLIERTIPEKPNSRLQKYRLTERGRKLIIFEES